MRKLARLSGPLVNLALGARRSIREAQAKRSIARIVAKELAVVPSAAVPYSRLFSSSLAVAAMNVSSEVKPRLNLVLATLPVDGAFAGLHTALISARGIAKHLGLPIRVLIVDPGAKDSAAKVKQYLNDTFSLAEVEVVHRELLFETSFGARDYWVATHWKTAHAIQVAALSGRIDAERVAYLIQDYEPGFNAWSTNSVIAESTYQAGFLPIVNSAPLWTYLSEAQNVAIDQTLVFAPAFDHELLRRAAEARRRSDTVTVFFYGRPSKARNLFEVGISALRDVAQRLSPDVPVRFISAGEPHADIDLGGGHTLASLGRLTWEEYFNTLSTVQVVLSLQQTPHPSHLPFDAAISGALSITNDFAGGRKHLHPRIVAVPGTTASLSAALIEAIVKSVDAEPAGYQPLAEGSLGAPLDAVLEEAVNRLRSEG